MKESMSRFTAIDGLRAWLAWLVVLSHVVQEAGMGDAGRFWHAIFESGGWAVRTFIIISGFVITHLLLERKEPYRAYIVRRFMRLYPCFMVCCALGAAAYWEAAHFGDRVWFAEINAVQFDAQNQHFWANVLAHMAMFHGVLPNNILSRSEYAFLPPGWSVSLEWQFYLIAPFLIFCFQSSKKLLMAALTVSAFTFCYSHWLAFYWLQPSMILGAAQYFFFGMLSRFAIEGKYGNFRLPLPLIVCVTLGGGFFLFTDHSIGIWVLALSFMSDSRDNLEGLKLQLFRFLHIVFEGRTAQFLAKRSYSTYLLHFPVLLVIGSVTTHYLHQASGTHLVPFLLLTLPITFILQEPLYRWVEVPGQIYGKRWARALGEPPIIERPLDISVLPVKL